MMTTQAHARTDRNFVFAALALVSRSTTARHRSKKWQGDPGSWILLIRNITVFALQYAMAVAAARHLDSHIGVAMIGRAVSGATAGYFAGWKVSLLRSYRAADPAGDQRISAVI